MPNIVSRRSAVPPGRLRNLTCGDLAGWESHLRDMRRVLASSGVPPTVASVLVEGTAISPLTTPFCQLQIILRFHTAV